jgi:hypothetical protein
MKRDSNVMGLDIAKRVFRVIGPALAQVNFSAKEAVSMSSHGAMRRNRGCFALISVGQRGHQTLLLRLSPVLLNALVMCDSLITPSNCWRKTTWSAFQPFLPPGRHALCDGLGRFVTVT